MADEGLVLLNDPGIVGFLGQQDGIPVGRLLITDDRAEQPLVDHLDHPGVGFVVVADTAPRCLALVEAAHGFALTDAASMMTRPRLDDLPTFDLPGGLERAPVGAGGVTFDDAVLACLAFDEYGGAPETTMRQFLRTLPRASLLAAVDRRGAVHATSGSGVFGDDAVVISVTTDPAWRGRGVATAMTAAALQAARANGATRASLDATPLGEPIYRRLGFDHAGGIRRFLPTNSAQRADVDSRAGQDRPAQR
jgi:GNAT superfamily N-acetyltransferase